MNVEIPSVTTDARPQEMAIALGAHRNTVLNRLRRAQDLLPEPLAGRPVEVALALELARWLGTPGQAG